MNEEHIISKKKRFLRILQVISILLFVAGALLLFSDFYKKYKRKEKVEIMTSKIASFIEETNPEEVEPTITFVVDPRAYEISGEDYDIDENDSDARERIDEEISNLPDEVTLNGIGLITIDKINITYPIWDEATIVSLRYGIGHYENSVLPGQNGNCTLLGHHMQEEGVMFNRLDELVVGDLINITTVDGTLYVYEVDSSCIISPENLHDYIEGDLSDDKIITLVTCAYVGPEKQRLIVRGHLVDD